MNEELKMKLAKIEELAKEDDLYLHLYGELSPLEEDVNLLTETLSQKKRAILWEFVMQCEQISRRKLEIACKHMEFKDEGSLV